jgi:hypothetical protein
MPPAQIKKTTLGLLWTEGKITPQVLDRRAVGGAYPPAELGVWIGFGRLSRVRSESFGNFQFFSMNFTIEA